jgi:hypothetical protein
VSAHGSYIAKVDLLTFVCRYMNNIVELAYMIPNAVPEITSHYCIGVLWTVPVQLQYTYVVLGATVVIRDVRNPWKRFGVYTVVILAGWYARVC